MLPNKCFTRLLVSRHPCSNCIGQTMFAFAWLLLTAVVTTAENAPSVYWSMELVNNSMIAPDIGDRTIYSADISQLPSVSVVAGFHGNALKIDYAKVLMGNLAPPADGSCFTDPLRCEGTGLTVGMWLRIDHHGGDETNCIFTSSERCTLGDTGVSLYQSGGSKNAVHSVVRLSNGSLYTASCYIKSRQWLYLALTWSPWNGIKLYTNCSEANYTEAPNEYHYPDSTDEARSIRIGDTANGHVILVDELALWDEQLSPPEVARCCNASGYSPTNDTSTTTQAITTTTTTATATTTTTTTIAATTTLVSSTTKPTPQTEIFSSSTDTTLFATTINTQSTTTQPSTTSSSPANSSNTQGITTPSISSTTSPGENSIVELMDEPLFWIAVLALIIVIIVTTNFLCFCGHKRHRQRPLPEEVSDRNTVRLQLMQIDEGLVCQYDDGGEQFDDVTNQCDDDNDDDDEDFQTQLV